LKRLKDEDNEEGKKKEEEEVDDVIVVGVSDVVLDTVKRLKCFIFLEMSFDSEWPN